jgi:RHS repeat-associated protein
MLFKRDGNGQWVPAFSSAFRLNSTSSGYQLINEKDEQEFYDDVGVLASIITREGRNYYFSYDSYGMLANVVDDYGRKLVFASSSDHKSIASVTDQNGISINYNYIQTAAVGAQLSGVSWTDAGGVIRQRTYLFELSSAPTLITGIVEDAGRRYSTYTYDSQKRVASTTLWSDSAHQVNEVTFAYPNELTTVVTSPLGMISTYDFAVIAGVEHMTGSSQPCAFCGAYSSQSITYDTNGYVDLVTDFNGAVTDYDYNPRGLETQRIESKARPDSASPTEKRTIQTDWHASFRVPTERRTLNAANVLEAKVQWAYNSRGQATARCEIDPADATAMSYTCSATSAPPAGAKVRRTVTTYCEPADVTAGTCPLVGLVTSVNGPRPAGDTGMAAGQDDRTTYTYYPSNDAFCAGSGACPHRKGDLWKVTNALGQVTEYVRYDKNGRVTRLKDANGTLTDFAYHPRGWLTSRTVRALASGAPDAADATTEIAYDAVGNVIRVTQPDGAYLAYAYDDAHRLIRITDNLADTIDYCPGGLGSADCLDAAGNRRIEQVKDPSGTIRRRLRRQYDQLSRLQKTLNAANAPTFDATGGYDGNGNLTQSADGLGTVTRQQYDGLNRLIATIQDDTGTDPATQDATTGYAYDARDNLRSVTDPDGLVTNYTYDGLNDLTALQSPDTGSSSYAYDAAGNRTSQTDARGITSTYTYDALNRLTAIGYPTTSLNVSFAYDQADSVTGCTGSFPAGRLTRMTDGTGSTTYCYDRRGNVTKKTQVTGTTTLVTQSTYTPADRLASITYPSGAIVSYGRDAIGRVTSVSWRANATATPITLVGNATYYPFGPLNTLTFGNGRTLSKTYDQDYAIDAIASSAAGGLTLDLGVDVMGNIARASATLNPAAPDRTYQYDPLYRLTAAKAGSTPLEAYTYSKTGDRQSAGLNGGTPVAYAYAAGTHRLASVGGVARTYDANGNTQSGTDAGGTFTYDDRNRLSGYARTGTTAQYQLNGRGERVGKAVTSGSGPLSILTVTRYAYDEGGQLLGDYGAPGNAQVEYVYLDTLPIAVVRAGNPAYLETDHLGTPRQVVDRTTNAVLWRWDFLASAFGTQAPTTSPSGGSAYSLNLRFPGQYFDAETGLHYNYFRDYEPVTGRYVEPDPIGLRGGPNPFLYAGANSLKFIDPFGLKNFCYYAPDFFYEWFPGKGYVKIQYNRTECVNIPDPPPPPSPDCLRACYESWNFCVFMADIKLFDVGVGLATGGPLASVRTSVGVVGGAVVSAGASAWGIGSDTVRKGCDVGYGRCTKNCDCRNSQ